jgi:hypothetical protein
VSKTSKAKSSGHEGRVTKKVKVGRYTPATPSSVKVSPSWYGPLILALFILGGLVILCNYLGVFGAATGWALLAGIILIGTGFGFATRYR